MDGAVSGRADERLFAQQNAVERAHRFTARAQRFLADEAVGEATFARLEGVDRAGNPFRRGGQEAPVSSPLRGDELGRRRDVREPIRASEV